MSLRRSSELQFWRVWTTLAISCHVALFITLLFFYRLCAWCRPCPNSFDMNLSDRFTSQLAAQWLLDSFWSFMYTSYINHHNMFRQVLWMIGHSSSSGDTTQRHGSGTLRDKDGNFSWIQGFFKPNDWVFRTVSPSPCSSWLYPDAKFGEDDGITDFYTTSTLQPKRMTSNISNDFCIYAIDLHIPIDWLGWSCRMKHQFNVVARCRKALSVPIRFVLVWLLGLRSRWSVHTDAYLGICDKYIYIIYTIIQLYTWMIHIHPSMDYLWIRFH